MCLPDQRVRLFGTLCVFVGDGGQFGLEDARVVGAGDFDGHGVPQWSLLKKPEAQVHGWNAYSHT